MANATAILQRYVAFDAAFTFPARRHLYYPQRLPGVSTRIPPPQPAANREPRDVCYTWRVMLSMNNVTMRFGPRVLFEDATATFMAGRRYAITGPNGGGKSTLMKILTGA